MLAAFPRSAQTEVMCINKTYFLFSIIIIWFLQFTLLLFYTHSAAAAAVLSFHSCVISAHFTTILSGVSFVAWVIPFQSNFVLK